MEKIKQADRNGATSLLEGWAMGHGGYETILTDVLEPVLLRIGQDWQTQGSFTVAQAYVAAKIAEEILIKIHSQTESLNQERPTKGQVVLGNIEDDFHALGRRMVSTFLQSNGWMVHDLGNDVLSSVFVDEAIRVNARVIGVSAMMLSSARNILKLRREIDARGLRGRLQLAVGGAVFLVRPDLVTEVGGDGTAPNALAASALFSRLWDESLSCEGGL